MQWWGDGDKRKENNDDDYDDNNGGGGGGCFNNTLFVICKIMQSHITDSLVTAGLNRGISKLNMGSWSDLGVLYWKFCGCFDDLKGTSLDVTASRGLDWEVSENDVGSVMLVDHSDFAQFHHM